MKKLLFILISLSILFYNFSFADHIAINPLVAIAFRGNIFSNILFAIVFTAIIILFITIALYKIFNIKQKPENKVHFYSSLALLLFVILCLTFFSLNSPNKSPIYLGGIGDYLVFENGGARQVNIFEHDGVGNEDIQLNN